MSHIYKINKIGIKQLDVIQLNSLHSVEFTQGKKK